MIKGVVSALFKISFVTMSEFSSVPDQMGEICKRKLLPGSEIIPPSLVPSLPTPSLPPMKRAGRSLHNEGLSMTQR